MPVRKLIKDAASRAVPRRPLTASPVRSRSCFLTPEAPEPVSGGGMRSASLLAYLGTKYDVDLIHVDLPANSRGTGARLSRNFVRLVRGRPPLFDRYSGHGLSCDGRKWHATAPYRVAVIEHFWCASYAATLRPLTDLLVLDLHNVESVLARSCARGVLKPAFLRFAQAYEKLEREYLPQFDIVLVASEDDRARVDHPRIVVFPNSLCPQRHAHAAANVSEAHALVFAGNMEYHPNVEAVRWFYRNVWPRLREEDPLLEWRLVGRNPGAIRSIFAHGENDRSVRIVGPVENAVKEIASVKVVIVPLLSGSGTRFKILEAWAARRAVVSTAIGAEGLGAESGRHLLIADDAEAFRKAIVRTLAAPESRRTLGENGYSLYQEQYTWPSAWKTIEEAGI